ncbi:putative phage protein gp47/JayE [Anoxybacillus kamchatkensis]|uniref:baseplate J/gp47 family protein n=1 Tax=Anoxybacillus ayderensis TaxID=265546 RepID=UPI0015ECBBFC|nr:baseplate J/gp47 family protein [Anoxybacillus ayderensis]MBA2878060.1 putative phage protein gp47/JayE [Anoxybacillus ayderensis]
MDKYGYKRKTYDELLNEMTDRTKQLFGEDANVTERSFLGILIRIMAWFLSLVWKDNEDVYYSANLNTATGNNLDRLLPRYGITRRLATHSEGPIQIRGTPGYIVPAGFLCSTNSGIFFETIEDIVLDENGDGQGTIRCIESGQIGNRAAGTITEIVNPDANVESVYNPLPTTGGREKETDQEVRERAQLSSEGLGKGTLLSLRAALLKVDGVRAATVIENYGDEVDSYGTPPRAFQAFVLGGDDQEIGQAIFETKAAGIQPYGDTHVTVADIAGYTHDIYFSRAQEVSIFTKVTVKKNNAFPADGENQIKSAIIRFIGGTDVSGSIYAGLNMGDDVIHSKLISIVYQVPGVDDVQVELSTDGVNYSATNVSIGIQEVAQTDADKIEVITVV